MRDRIALSTAAVAVALHLAVANRYDLFRDELYFIVCGRHPAFGYADQPPLVPLLAAAGYALGHTAWSVRLPAIAAAAALPWLMVAFTRLLGGGRWAAWVAGFGGILPPVFLGITGVFSTTSFELVVWTAVAYGLVRLDRDGDPRFALGAGLVAGLALEAKYAIVLWLGALGCGLLLTAQRRLLLRRDLRLGLLVACVIAAPSIAWQAAHGAPFLELARNAHVKDLRASPLDFALNQVLIYGPLLAPVWIFGVIAPFVIAALRPARFVAIAYAVSAVAIVATAGKDYYLAAAVPSMLVIGAVGLERVVGSVRLRIAYAAIAFATTLALAPIAVPILPPESVVPYERALHVTPAQQERADANAAFPSLFADMLGWHDFVREVGAAYARIPPAERPETAIVVDNYGEAAAIDLYGTAYGLTHALSGHNQYYLWGPGPASQSRNLLRVQDDVERLRPYCASVQVLGTTRSRYARPIEEGKVIAYCTGLHPPLASLWPELKNYI